MIKKILPGHRCGMLTVIEQVRHGRNPTYFCKCDCGVVKIVQGSGISSSKEPRKSCGCQQRAGASRPAGQAAWTVLFKRIKRNALQRGISFNLTFDEFVALSKQNCYYSGHSPAPYNPYIMAGRFKAQMTKETIDRACVLVNGIDRIDSNKGYDISNCVPCCSQCNYSKLDYTEEEFIQHAYSIVSYQERLKEVIT